MSTTPRPTSAEWSDVDQAAHTPTFAAYLDTVRAIDGIEAYKTASITRMGLRAGMAALDVGCGTGDDASKMRAQVGPDGRVLGVDFSAAMVEESRKRWVAPSLDFAVGDAHALDLPTGAFDATRADRVFQHLADPVGALGELARVTRPGGRVVIADPDWGTYVVDGTPTPALRRYLDFAREQARNPWIGRQLYGLFQTLGLRGLELAAHVIFVLDYAVLDRLGNLDAGFATAVAAGQLTEDDVAEVKRDLQARQRAGRFFFTLNVYTVSGVVG